MPHATSASRLTHLCGRYEPELVEDKLANHLRIGPVTGGLLPRRKRVPYVTATGLDAAVFARAQCAIAAGAYDPDATTSEAWSSLRSVVLPSLGMVQWKAPCGTVLFDHCQQALKLHGFAQEIRRPHAARSLRQIALRRQ